MTYFTEKESVTLPEPDGIQVRLQELWDTKASLSEEIEKRNLAEKNYERCFSQLQLYEKLNVKFKESMLDTVISEPKQNREKMVSVHVQTDLKDSSKLKTISC